MCCYPYLVRLVYADPGIRGARYGENEDVGLDVTNCPYVI